MSRVHGPRRCGRCGEVPRGVRAASWSPAVWRGVFGRHDRVITRRLDGRTP